MENVGSQSKKVSRKSRPGTAARRDIRKQRASDKSKIPTAPFRRMMLQALDQVGTQPKKDGKWRLSDSAVKAMKEATEVYAITFLTNLKMVAAHAKRDTIQPADILLVNRIAC